MPGNTLHLHRHSRGQLRAFGRAYGTVTAVITKAPVTCTVSDTRHEYDAGEKQAQVTVDTAVRGYPSGRSDYTVRYEQDGAPATPVNTGSYTLYSRWKDNLRFDGMDDVAGTEGRYAGDHPARPIPRPTP